MEEIKFEVRQVSEREILVGENRIYLSDDNILCFISVGDTDGKEALAVTEASCKLMSLVEGKVPFLIDLNKVGKQTAGARKVWKKGGEDAKIGKNAVFGLHPVARVVASFVLSVSNKKDSRFFKTREEAVAWLKE
jgi:hypothetical protein